MARALQRRCHGARARKTRGAAGCTLVAASFCPSAVLPNRTAAVASLQNTRSQARPRAERRMLRKASIPALRQQIDRIDDQLLRLLSRRAELALAIAEQKARSNSEVYAPAREKGVLERLARANRGPLPAHLVRAIFREIISASRSLEQRLRIAYLGPEATFTHLAARQQFGAAADYLSAASVADVFHEVESERADLGVVPVENSTEGMVAHTLDLLADSPLQICASACGCATMRLMPLIPVPSRASRLCRTGSEISAQICSGESARRSSVCATMPSVEFSTGTTPRSARSLSTSWNTSATEAAER